MVDKKGYLKKEYKLFHIRDKEEKVFDFHYHDFYKIIVFLEGSVVYSIEGKNYELKEGDIVLVAKNEIHKPIVNPNVPYERIVLYLSQSFLSQDKALLECFKRARENHTNVMRLSAHDFAKIKELCLLSEKNEQADNPGHVLYAKLQLLEALLIINDSVYRNGILFEGKVSYDQKIVEVCDFIEEHLSDDLSVDFLSKQFYISKYYFMRRFKEYTGVSLHQYIIEKRLLRTSIYVEDGEKVVNACKQAGFKDYSTYLRAKKRQALRLVSTFEKE